MLNKRRNAVDKALWELAEQIKTNLSQRLYAAFGELKLQRKDAAKLLGVAVGTVDEAYGAYAKHFDKELEALLKAIDTSASKKAGPSTKSR